MSSSNCCFLTCIQISQEADQVVWDSHLLKNFPQFIVIHTVKGFGIVNKAEIEVFLELSCFFYNLTDLGNLISGSSAFSKTNLNVWKFTVHVLLKPGLHAPNPMIICPASQVLVRKVHLGQRSLCKRRNTDTPETCTFLAWPCPQELLPSVDAGPQESNVGLNFWLREPSAGRQPQGGPPQRSIS